MNFIYIVLNNGVVDEVFTTREAAEAHRQNLAKKWNLTAIIEKELKVL